MSLYIPQISSQSEPYVDEGGLLVPVSLRRTLGDTDLGRQIGALFIAGLNADGSVSVQPVLGANGRITAGGPAPGQVARTFTGVQAGGAGAISIPLETVPTGKTLYITDIYVSMIGGPGAGQLFTITAGGVAIFNGSLNNTKGVELAGIETQMSASSTQAVALGFAAGSTGATFSYFISGFEQ